MSENLSMEQAYANMESAYMELSYKAERLQAENEEIREKLAKIKYAALSLDSVKKSLIAFFTEHPFLSGYLLATIMLLIFDLFRRD